mgnify:FL=1|jgi:6-pyruvoyltetrahydropterin/6-carboxytetrahydropterin synthase
MALTRIAKEFRWEMGHRLPFHEGLCRNLHGHSYSMRVEIEGETDLHGMVMDYYDIKTIVQPIVDKLDHAFLCDEGDEVMKEFFHTNPMKTVMVPFYTTAENIAAYMLGHICDALAATPSSVHRVMIRVYETEKTYAEVERVFTKDK